MKQTLLTLLALALLAPAFASATLEKKTKATDPKTSVKTKPHADRPPDGASKPKAKSSAAKAGKKASPTPSAKKPAAKTKPAKPAPKTAPKAAPKAVQAAKTKPRTSPPVPKPKVEENDDESPDSMLGDNADSPKPVVKTTAPLSLEEALSKLNPEEALRLQVFLDRALFVPGKVDGQTGEFTLKAARRWMSAETGRATASLLEAAQAMPWESTTLFEVPADASRFVGQMPATLEEKAAAKTLPYTSLAEYVAERYHTDEATISRLNPDLRIEALNEGDSVRAPNVIPFKIEAPRLDSSTAARLAGASIQILHDERMLEVRRGDDVVAAFPITVGGKPEYIRAGVWRVECITPNPSFIWDDAMLKTGRSGDKQFLLPPGPNNPVGVLWMGLQPVSGPEAHIGIHGTSDPSHIGRNQSSGCIRLANWDVVRLARLVGPGTKVTWGGGETPGKLLAKAP